MESGKLDELRPYGVHVRRQPLREDLAETLEIPRPVQSKRTPMQTATQFVRRNVGAALGGALFLGLLAGRFARASAPQPAPVR
jgi:hypothetical protein